MRHSRSVRPPPDVVPVFVHAITTSQDVSHWAVVSVTSAIGETGIRHPPIEDGRYVEFDGFFATRPIGRFSANSGQNLRRLNRFKRTLPIIHWKLRRKRSFLRPWSSASSDLRFTYGILRLPVHRSVIMSIKLPNSPIVSPHKYCLRIWHSIKRIEFLPDAFILTGEVAFSECRRKDE